LCVREGATQGVSVASGRRAADGRAPCQAPG
jgi:hypothetical protein